MSPLRLLKSCLTGHWNFIAMTLKVKDRGVTSITRMNLLWGGRYVLWPSKVQVSRGRRRQLGRALCVSVYPDEGVERHDLAHDAWVVIDGQVIE